MTPERALMQRELPASPSVYSFWGISGIVRLRFPQKLMNTHAAATVNPVMVLRSRHQPWWFVEKQTAYLFHMHTMEQHLDWTLCCGHVLAGSPSCHHWQLWHKEISIVRELDVSAKPGRQESEEKWRDRCWCASRQKHQKKGKAKYQGWKNWCGNAPVVPVVLGKLLQKSSGRGRFCTQPSNFQIEYELCNLVLVL